MSARKSACPTQLTTCSTPRNNRPFTLHREIPDSWRPAISLFFQALLVNNCKLLLGPVTGEIAVLTEHFFLVVHFLGEVKVFNVGVGARVVPPSVKVRVIVMKDFVVGVMLGVAPRVHGRDRGNRL